MFQLQLLNGQSAGYSQPTGAGSSNTNNTSNYGAFGGAGTGVGPAQNQQTQPFLWLLNSASMSLSEQTGMATAQTSMTNPALQNYDFSGIDLAALNASEGEPLPPGLLALLGKGFGHANTSIAASDFDADAQQSINSVLSSLGLDAADGLNTSTGLEGIQHLAEQLNAYQQGSLDEAGTALIDDLMVQTGLSVDQLEQGLGALQAMLPTPAELSAVQAALPGNVSVQASWQSTRSFGASQTGAHLASGPMLADPVNSAASAAANTAANPLVSPTGVQQRNGTKQDGAGLIASPSTSAEGLSGAGQNSLNLGLSQSGGLNSLVSESDISFKQALNQTMQGPMASVQAEQDIGEMMADTTPDIAEEGLTKADASRAADIQNRQTQQALKPYTTNVFSQVGEPDWSEEMNEKVMWLSSRNIKSAQIQLNPVELGPVEVKVSVQNDQTSISFNVQNGNVRELLEANVHRLREMMDGNGVALADVNVGSEQSFAAFAQGQGQEQGSGEGNSSLASGDSALDADEAEILAETALSSDRLVDERV